MFRRVKLAMRYNVAICCVDVLRARSVLEDTVYPNEHNKMKRGQISTVLVQRLKDGRFRFKNRPDHAFYCFRSF